MSFKCSKIGHINTFTWIRSFTRLIFWIAWFLGEFFNRSCTKFESFEFKFRGSFTGLNSFYWIWFKLCVLSSPELVRSLNFIKLNMSFHNRSQLTTKVDVRKIVNQCKYVLLQMCITLSDELSHVSTWIKSDLD